MIRIMHQCKGFVSSFLLSAAIPRMARLAVVACCSGYDAAEESGQVQ